MCVCVVVVDDVDGQTVLYLIFGRFIGDSLWRLYSPEKLYRKLSLSVNRIRTTNSKLALYMSNSKFVPCNIPVYIGTVLTTLQVLYTVDPQPWDDKIEPFAQKVVVVLFGSRIDFFLNIKATF